MVSEIQFTNYKIFKEKQSLKLKPVTILLGKNNSGKSAVAKLPLLIGNLLKNEPISLKIRVGTDSRNSVELGSAFKDLVYNRNEIGILTLSMIVDTERIDCLFNQRDVLFELKLNGSSIDLGNEHYMTIPSKKLDLSNFRFNCDYIGAIRVSPDGDYQNSAEKFDKIGINGQNAYLILIQDFENDSELINKISRWYSEKFEGWSISIKKIESSEIKYEVVLENGLSSINIKQTGQGIHQVLPLIVRSYMPETEPTLIVVEEPETHLHPAAHGDLAQRFVESVLEDKNKKYLIETHSQNFVLRIRRLIAEGRISHDDFALYFTEYDQNTRSSCLKEIEIDGKGNILNDDWPKGIFSEASVEVRGILNAQMEYSTSDD